MSEITDWFRSVPLITRSWFGASIVFPLAARFGLISGGSLALFSHLVFNRFQIWRPVTAAFIFPIGFKYLMNLYFLYNYSIRLETGVFNGRPADYVFMLLFNWICIVIIGLLMNMPLLMVPMVMSVLYVWAQFNKDTIVSFWFGTRFKAYYLPWLILIFHFIIDGSFVEELTGNLVGHLYFFLMYKYPVDLGGRAFLSTPEILYRYFPTMRGGSGFGVPPTRRPAAPEQERGRHNWGQGFRLGGE